MQLNQIKAFLAAADTGSIRAAARSLNIAQPAVSSTIHKLEQELGILLLQRSSSGVELTPAGLAFRERANLAITELERGRSEVAQMQGQPKGNVNIALTSTMALLMIAHTVQQFQRHYPDVQLNVIDGTYEEVYNNLRRGTLDFSVGPMSPAMIGSSEMKTQLLLKCPMVALVRKKHPALECSKSLADLLGYHWIFPSDGGGLSEATFKDRGLPLPRVVRCRSMPVWLPLLLENDFIALLPRLLLRVGMLNALLEPLQVTDPIRAASYYLFSRSKVPLTPVAEKLADQFGRTARRLITRSSLDLPPSGRSLGVWNAMT